MLNIFKLLIEPFKRKAVLVLSDPLLAPNKTSKELLPLPELPTPTDDPSIYF